MKFIVGCLLSALMLQIASSAKIISVLPMAVKSHGILYDRLMKELAKRGHDVTFITPLPSKLPTNNIREIVIPDFRDALAFGNMMKNDTFQARRLPQWLMMSAVPWIGSKVSSLILEQPEVQALLKSDEKFDLIFGEPFIDESIIAGFSYKYNAPIVALSTLMPNTWSNYLVGNPAPAATTPDPFLAFAPPLTLLQRIANFLNGVLSEINQQASLFMHNRVLKQHFGADAPCIQELLLNTSLLLVNHHPSLSFARPQTPNTVDVAGMHIYPPQPLPKELEEFMQSAKHGVILFSLGTNVQSSHMPKALIDSILQGFAKMRENILWKFEEELENLPKNVKIAKWLPQSDILAHPKLKLFITHGGLLSTTEAVFRGVPIVGIPVMADQPVNMQHTENAGLGITLLYEDLSGETLYNAATEVISNPKYREVAKEKSRQLRDTPMTALDTAVWWIEFVLRNKGASHLKDPSRSLWWYQRHLLDVLLLVALASVALIYLNACILKKTYRWLRLRFTKCHQKTKESKKNQ